MTPEQFQKQVEKDTQAKQQATQDQQQKDTQVQHTQAVVDTIGEATKALIKFQSKHQPKVSVTNQKLPTSIKTPDVQKVVDALENLKQPILENKVDHTPVIEALNQLNDSIAKLPTSFPEAPEPVEEVTVKNQPDYTKQFDSLGRAISKIDVKPVVNIPEEQPDDYTPILDSLSNVIEAVQAIKIPKVPTTDLSPLIQATAAVQQSIQDLRFPVANYILPFTDTTGKAAQSPTPFVDKPYDYVNVNVGGSTADVYTFYIGGSGGALQRTVTLNYADSTKAVLSNVART